MNPFASVDDFESLRQAALAETDIYKRFVRQLRAPKQAATHDKSLELPDRIVRMTDLAIGSGPAVLLVGPPGTGKTQALREAIDRIDADPEAHGFSAGGVDANWVTPEEEWTYETLVLGETVIDGTIVSVEGILLESLREGKWLVLDEANRADMDRIFGGVLTWLSGRRVRVGDYKGANGTTTPVYLDWSSSERSYRHDDTQAAEIVYYAGTDWRMVGTYNAVDAQRVFRMGQALSRRFLHVPIPPIEESAFQRLINERVPDSELGRNIAQSVGALYNAHIVTPDAEIGPALFLSIPRYLLAAVATLDSSEVQAGDETLEAIEAAVLSQNLFDELLSEAYLASVGSFIARFEPDLLDSIGVEIMAKGAISPSSWEWILTGLQWMRA